MEFLIAIILIPVALALLSIIVIGIFYAIDFFLDLPYVATKRDKVDTIVKLAQIKKGDEIVDLGSGDGRLLFAAAQYGATAYGYEVNPFLIVLTRLRAQLKGLSKNVIVKNKNLWQADLKIADVIFVYGRKKTMKKFQDFVYKNASRRTRVVVNTNPFPDKKSIKEENGIFFYKV